MSYLNLKLSNEIDNLCFCTELEPFNPESSFRTCLVCGIWEDKRTGLE